jgi:hypothetical protein
MAALGLAVLLAAGCSTVNGTSSQRGLLVGTADAGETGLPAGVRRAVIYEIDGVRVATGQRTVSVSPGVHLIRAAPVVPGPSHQVPSSEILATSLRNHPVRIDVAAGQRYLIGIRWLEAFDYQRRSGSYEAVAFPPGALSSSVLGQEPP